MKFLRSTFLIPFVLFSAPLNESFTRNVFPPVGWQVINNDGGNQNWQRDTNNPRTQPAAVSSRYESNVLRNDDWLITPRLICSAQRPDTLKFWYCKNGGGNPESLEVWLSNSTNNINAFNTLLWRSRFTHTNYLEKVIALDTFDGQEIYIAFVNKGLYGFRLMLDDISGPEMVEICDVGVDSVIAPVSFVKRPVGSGFYPQAIIANYGNTTQHNIAVICSIVGQMSGLVYQSVKWVDSLVINSQRIISFDLFTPEIAQLCSIKVKIALTNDTNPSNDRKTMISEIVQPAYCGGPDNGFYYWIDSDTTNGPVYNWIDISLSGSPLISGDAWVQGPIPIGFSFNYYGDAKEYFYYSTNGFITFDEISLSYNTNYPIPSNNLPNNVVAPFWDDLYTYQARHQTFGTAPNRYKVVQWKSIVYNQAVLRDTVIFQIILYENGNIVFQYHYCTNYHNLGLGQSATVGIENTLGNSGLQYLYNDNVVGNRLSANRAIRFYRSCHDVMVETIITGYVGLGDSVKPKIVVKNIGTFIESFNSVFYLRNSNQQLIYTDTCAINGLAPSQRCTVLFRDWIANQFGEYPAQTWTALSEDDNLLNDTCHKTIVVTLASPYLLNPANNVITNNCNVLFDWTDVFQASRYNLVVDGSVDTIVNLSQYGPRNFYEGIYNWRVRAGNFNSWGLWSETYTFIIDTSRPMAPNLILPMPNCTLFLSKPNFLWFRVTDAAQYNILIYTSYDTVINQIISDTNFTPQQPLLNGMYFWKVRSCDLAGNWSNYSPPRQFFLQYPTWLQRCGIPELHSNKPVGAGGSLTAVGNDNIFALKGNNTQDFYAYNSDANTWIYLSPIPFRKSDTIVKCRKVKAGGALVYDGVNYIYAIKGNRTKELWAYNILEDSWIKKQPVPSIRGLSCGSSLAYINGAIYCLIGNSSKFEFYKYIIVQDSWVCLSPMPKGQYNMRYRDGSCLAAVSNDKLFALKGSARINEFYEYDILNDSWQIKNSLPYFHPITRKKNGVKSGGAMCAGDNNVIYAVKGGGSNEFWQYQISNDRWCALDTIPRLNKRSVVKGGAALAYLDNKVFLMKGNKTNEFWSYQIENNSNSNKLDLIEYETIKHANNISNALKIVVLNNNFTIVHAGEKYNFGQLLSYKIYNQSGQLIKSIVCQVKDNLWQDELISLPKGVYIILIEQNN